MPMVMVLWCLLLVLLLAGAFPTLGPSGGEPAVIFGSPVFVLLLGAFGLMSLCACLRRLRTLLSLKGLGFMLSHAGCALLLVGAGIGLFKAQDVNFYARVTEEATNQLPIGKDQTLTLDFSLALTAFDIEWYPAYALQTPAPDGAAEMHTMHANLQPDESGAIMRPGKTPPFSPYAVQDGFHGWLAWQFLPLRWCYTEEQRTAKVYRATMKIVEPGQPERSETFVVNRPLSIRGWRFFIMNYNDTPHGRMVGLKARRDPGRPWVIAGIWMLLVGMPLLCWCRQTQATPMPALVMLPSASWSEANSETLVLAAPLTVPILLDALYLKAFLGSAVLGYAGALTASLCRRPRLAWSLFWAAWLTNVLAVLSNWLLCGHPPLGNMYHVLVVLSLCFFPQYLLVCRRQSRIQMLPLFAGASALPLVGTFFMQANAQWLRPPVLQSPWFVPHVLSYMISYATCTVAFLVLLGSFWGEEQRRQCCLAESRKLVRLSLPLMTFGLWSGALWAEEAWGVYWSWDPKETWALITWLLYLLSLHCRRTPRWQRAEKWFQLAAFAALLITFLVVNLLPKFAKSIHSYAAG